MAIEVAAFGISTQKFLIALWGNLKIEVAFPATELQLELTSAGMIKSRSQRFRLQLDRLHASTIVGHLAKTLQTFMF